MKKSPARKCSTLLGIALLSILSAAISHAAPIVTQSIAWADGTRNPAPAVAFDVVNTDSILVATIYADTDTANISNVRFGDGTGIGIGDVAPQSSTTNGRLRSYLFINPSVANSLAFRFDNGLNAESEIPGTGVIVYEVSGAKTSLASITTVTASNSITTPTANEWIVSFAGRNSNSDGATENSPLFTGEDHAILGPQVIGGGALASASAAASLATTYDITWTNATDGTIAYAFQEAIVTDELIIALNSLEAHIRGTTLLTDPEITSARQLLDAQKTRFGENASIIEAAMDLVAAYDNVVGPLFLVGPSTYDSSNGMPSINRAVLYTMQYLMDYAYTAETIAQHRSLLDGFKFGSSAKFPGAVAPPAPGATHTATVSASFPESFGRDGTAWNNPARKPTGCYLAPGTIATVTVPAALVGKGYQIRVGAHSSNLPTDGSVRRVFRITRAYTINSTSIDVANPLGGGIYLEVPRGRVEGIVDITVQGAVRSPFFSRKPFHNTTNAEWVNGERDQPAPWADFQTEKFMMQVPSHWIRGLNALNDPETLMADWDKAINAMNEVMGFPLVRGKESMYLQVDVRATTGGFQTGYPAVNHRNVDMVNLTTPIYSGSKHLVKGPQFSNNVEFHEQGHSYGAPKMSMDGESLVNMVPMIMQNKGFGMGMEQVFVYSLNFEKYQNRSLDSTAIYWMTTFSFSPLERTMSNNEAKYQAQGHAKYADVARLFGWQGLTNHFYEMNAFDDAGISYSKANDDMVVRLSRGVGKDVRPLLHFWGVSPANAPAMAGAVRSARLRQAPEIYDTLIRYKTLVPADNAAFRAWANRWYSVKPSTSAQPKITGVDQSEREHARQWDNQNLFVVDTNPSTTTMPRPANNEMFTGDSAAEITARIQELIDLYFPNGRPSAAPPTWTMEVISGLDAATGSSYQSSLAGHVNYAGGNVPLIFSKTSGPGWLNIANDGTLSGTPGAADAGVNSFTVLVDDGYGGLASATLNINVAELNPDITPPPVPGFATPPTGIAATAITMAATTVIDPEGSGVQYRFHNTTLATDSGWQAGTTWTNTGLTPETTYSYTVQARDIAPAFNESAHSAPQSGTTLEPSTNAIWNVDANSTWVTHSNWNPASAPGSISSTTNTSTATFGTIITADRAITVDTNRNISGIDFAANSFAYNLSGGNLLLSNGGSVKTSGGGTAHTDIISSPIAIQSNAGTAVFTGGSSTATRLLVIGGDVTGVSTATNVTNLTLNGSNTGNNAITGIIGDGSGGGKLAVVKSGSGLWRLSNANTFSGGFNISGGTLTLATLTDSLGAAGSSITVTGNSTLGFAGAGDRLIEKSLLVNDGFTLTLSADTALSNHTFSGVVSGNGTIKASGAGGAVFNRAVILSNAANTFTGPIDLSATGATISVASIGDTVGSGTIIMNTSGGQGSAFQLDATAVASLTLTNRVFSIRGTQPGIINNSNTTAANTLTINSNLAATAGADRRLQLGGVNSGNNTFAGLISNSSATSIGLVKADGGKWIVSNANTYTGKTTINAGTLSINSIGNVNGGASALGKPNSVDNGRILMGSGNSTATLLYSGPAASTDRTIQINSSDNTNTGGATITNNGSALTFTAPTFNNAYTAGTNTRRLTLGGDNGGTIQGKIQNNSGTGLVGVTKSGEGTWILGGGNTYTGTTVIDAGTLLINGDSSLVTGAVSVNNTSTLGGSGTLRGNVTVAAGANLAPSTLYLGGNLTLSAMAGGAGQLIYELNTPAASDRIAVTGTLNIGTGLLGLSDFDFTKIDGLQDGTYTLITSGTLTGSLNAADVDGTLDEAALQLQISGNHIVLVVRELDPRDPYETWATGGETFDGDANGDGVDDGLAFLLGAAGPGDNALGLLPEASENTGGLVLTFQMRDSSARGTASLQLEYSTDLATGSWTTVAVPDTSSTVGDIVFTITGTGPLDVTATIPASKAAAGKLFSRLKAYKP